MALLLLPLALAGCATLINDQRETIRINSEPAGAVVSVECGSSPVYGGVTPANILIERTADPCSFTIAKEGYAERRVELERQISRATKGNKAGGVVAGTVFGFVAFLASIDSSFLWDDPISAAHDGYQIGAALGEEPANALDRKTGAAYKHAPGKILVRLDPLP